MYPLSYYMYIIIYIYILKLPMFKRKYLTKTIFNVYPGGVCSALVAYTNLTRDKMCISFIQQELLA